jgi:L-iditol 2-dehydrogenase
MLAARLHGVRDLRVERLDVPVPGPRDLLVEVEACGVCPTDMRKYLIGTSDGYPLNPGHEWVGRVVATGAEVDGWEPGRRVYGDIYAGYAEYALLPAEPAPWSHGPLAVDDGLPAERAVFVEPLADCLHAVHDQARLRSGDRAVVIGAGQMGLQLVLAAARAGASVLCVEPIAERRRLALRFGAGEAVGDDGWEAAARDWCDDGADAVILTIGVAALVAPALELAAPGGRIVLFAGFGDDGAATVDLNRIHYRELVLVGSEWIGTPPGQRPERYGEAHALLAGGDAPLEELVTATCDLNGVERALLAHRDRRALKTVLVPRGA